MGTEVLRPQDCLTRRIRISPAVFHCRRTTYHGFSNDVPKVKKPVIRSENTAPNCKEQRKRSPVRYSPEKSTISKRSASSGDLTYRKPHLVPENIKVLRRGESLMSINENAKKSEQVTVRVGLPDVYAGSAVAMSPSPRALPVPSFFKKGGDRMCVDDSATKDLRRLLGLDVNN